MHGRPKRCRCPARASYVAVLVDLDDRPRERAHLEALCERFAVPLPRVGATHLARQLGKLRLKWERHGEFSGYLIIAAGAASWPFAEPAATLMPADWLASVPGQTIAAVHVDIVPGTGLARDSASLAGHFDGHAVIGAAIAEGAGAVFSDFRLHDDGFSRWLVLDERPDAGAGRAHPCSGWWRSRPTGC